MKLLLPQSRPGRVTDHNIEGMVELFRDARAEASKSKRCMCLLNRGVSGRVITVVQKHLVTEVLREFERFGRPWRAIDLDGRNVKSKRSKAQGGFADFEAAKLVIEDTLNRPGVGPFPIHSPALAHKAAKSQN